MAFLTPEEIAEQQKNEETTKLHIITPAIQKKWTDPKKIIMEYVFTDGRISIDEYNVPHNGKKKKADYLLLHRDNVLLAIVEAKGQDVSADAGYQQAVDYARILDVPFAYSTNGIDLIEKDMVTGLNRTMKLDQLPGPEELWGRYKAEKDISTVEENVITYPYYYSANGKKPRYYQRIAINRVVEKIVKGENRLLLVMATGTGKTFTAFQIIWRLWKTGLKKKVLFLADRNILVDQTMRKDFKPFMEAMEKIDNAHIKTSKDIYLALYQQLKSYDTDYYKMFRSDFFDLIVVDECHRSSATSDSNWHEILEYFSSAVQIGLTATPREEGVVEALKDEEEARMRLENAILSGDVLEKERAYNALNKAVERRKDAESETNAAYFGNPIYTYSLKQGIDDGFLAPYKVISVELDIDKYGYKPEPGMKDTDGNPVEDRIYHQNEFDKRIVVVDRRRLIAKRISDYMKTTDRYGKTIVFCEDISHVEEMVRLLENENADLVEKNSRYIMQITGDNEIGKKQLDNFVDPSSRYPVIAVTSRLMSTGVDAETCENIVLDRSVGSMTEFKQIIGRGTRIKKEYEVDGEEKSKMHFTILDFRKNYLKFQDPAFDGDPVTVTNVTEGGDFPKPPEKPHNSPSEVIASPDSNKKIRVNGVDVSIIDENVTYLDKDGKLVKQNLDSCVRNNILSQYPVFEDFRKAWLVTKDKERFASDLLLVDGLGRRFMLQYGYSVDDFDIIACLGYDMAPPLSKHQRTQNEAIAIMMNGMDDEKKLVGKTLLDAYVETNFQYLRDIKTVFSMPAFSEMGYTPLKVIKDFFGSKDKYFQFLYMLENKLYE